MIIIETPAPPTRERLVLVPHDRCTGLEGKPGLVHVVATVGRHPTDEDLERAGWVRASTAEREILDAVERAHRAEHRALRAELEANARAEKTERDAERRVAAAVARADEAANAAMRREQCLVTRAVEANVDVRIAEDSPRGFMVGVHAPGCDDEDLSRGVPAADVPATLARLLDEVKP